MIEQNAIAIDGNGAAREQFSKLDATLTRFQEQQRRAAATLARLTEFSTEVAMNSPVLLVAMLAALPGPARAQADAAPSAPRQPACPDSPEARGATGALPARAGTTSEPQRGSVAPATRVASHMATPSSRAMAAASARAEKTTGEENHVGGPCKRAIAPNARKSGSAQEEDG